MVLFRIEAGRGRGSRCDRVYVLCRAKKQPPSKHTSPSLPPSPPHRSTGPHSLWHHRTDARGLGHGEGATECALTRRRRGASARASRRCVSLCDELTRLQADIHPDGQQRGPFRSKPQMSLPLAPKPKGRGLTEIPCGSYRKNTGPSSGRWEVGAPAKSS